MHITRRTNCDQSKPLWPASGESQYTYKYLSPMLQVTCCISWSQRTINTCTTARNPLGVIYRHFTNSLPLRVYFKCTSQ